MFFIFNKRFIRHTFGLLLITCITILGHSYPAFSDNNGLMIAQEARDRDGGFSYFTAEMSMILRNKNGQESNRQLQVKILEVEGDGNKSLFIFDNPRDVKGTAFLIHGHRDSADDQWIFLPALKRVKRISSANRAGSFMGSEFSYEDMSVPEIDKYSYKYQGEETCGDLTCTIIERVPVEKKSNYRRHLVWHDKQEYRIHKVQYFDRKNSHLKTLTFEDYKKYDDEFWRAHKLTMVNHQSGKSTEMRWSDFDFGAKVKAREFTQTGLKSAR